MRRKVFIGAWAWVALATLPVWGQRLEPTGAPALIPSRQNAFSIPFSVDGAPSTGPSAIEVQLVVSDDRGATWKIAGQMPPQAGRFPFRAAQDGEYWFMVRTVNPQGVLRPDGPPQPKLRVLVDTTPPQLELQATRGEAGVLVARWRVLDAHLRPDTLKLSYQLEGTGDAWQPVAVEIRQPASPGAAVEGEARWYPDRVAGAFNVRAEASDVAGNRAATQAHLAALAAPGGGVAEASPPAAEVTRSTTNEPFPGGQLPVAAPTANGELTNRPNPFDGVSTAPPQDALPGMTGVRPTVPSQVPPFDAAQAEPQPWGPPAAEAPPTNRLAGSGEFEPSSVMPPVRNQVTRPEPDPAATQPGASAVGGMVPAGVRPRMIAARRFEVEYEVPPSGSASVARVEMWVTRDGGQAWSTLGVDADGRSPFLVSLDADGVYGLRMTVELSTGARGSPPRTGELPEIWVGIDTLKPEARLAVAEPAADARPGEVELRWEARDAHLADRPITLLFRESTDGPWSTIAAGLENTGRYAWHVDGRLPERVWLRLEVRDEAGNLQAVELPEAVSTIGWQPQGRILNVRPAAE